MPTVVLLEVDHLEDELASRAPTPGLLPLAGRPLVSYAAQALRACGDVDRIVLAGPSCYAGHAAVAAEVDETVLVDEGLGARLTAVLERCGDAEELLFWPPNAPLLTPEMVEDFLRQAPTSAAVTWSAVRESRLAAGFPEGLDVPRYPFGGEVLTFPIFGLVRPASLAGQQTLLQRLLAHESFGRSELVKLLGVGFAIKFQAGRASLEELVRRLSDALDMSCVVQIAPHAELAFRVRNRAQHQTARNRLEGA